MKRSIKIFLTINAIIIAIAMILLILDVNKNIILTVLLFDQLFMCLFIWLSQNKIRTKK